MDFDIPSLYRKTTNDERFLLANRIQRVNGDPERTHHDLCN
jgi:hypothetical protein